MPGIGLLHGSHFPEELRGNLLITNAIGFQGVAQYRFANEGATFHVEPVEPILFSKDPNFRPTGVRIGSDGALCVPDWQMPPFGHLQHNLRDPNRDHKHGRVYRVTYEGRELRKPVHMRGMNTEQVVSQLTSPEDDLRYRARLELTGRPVEEATAAAAKLAASLDANDPASGQALAETLWIHQMHKRVNEPLLRKVLASAEPAARAAAVRVIRDWHKEIENVGPLLVQLAADEDARVRAEAVISAVYYGGPEAAEVIFVADTRPKDLQLDFVLKEAQKSINVKGYIQEVLAAGGTLSPAAQLFTVREADVAQLMKLPPSEAVYLAILSRPQAKAPQLKYAVEGLAKARNESQRKLLIDLIAEQDAAGRADALLGAGELLLALPRTELAEVHDRPRPVATAGDASAVRQLGYAALIVAEDSGEEAFAAAGEHPETAADALASLGLVASGELRAKLYPQIKPLLDPASATGAASPVASSESGLRYAYYLPSANNVARETLDKLTPKLEGIAPTVTYDMPEIRNRDGFAMRFTGSLLVPRAGKYTFFLNSDDGSRLYLNGEQVIDHDGLHGPGDKSVELDLQAGAQAIEVTYFDNGGGDALSLSWTGPGIRRKQVIPTENFSTGGAATLQDAAVAALGLIPGRDAEKIRDLSILIRAGRSRAAAVRVLRTVALAETPKNQVRPLVDSLIAYLSLVPAKDRTGVEATEAAELTRSLAALLPEAQSKNILARLENLDVRVIAVSTVPERMIYDKERIVVEAGKPVELRLSNADQMPHNLALVLPGAMEEIGELAEATATEPDAMERQYVPKSEKVLLASKLLQPGEFEAISFEAPKQPGVYPYVCTYPGHWRRMYGMLVVVPDLAAYHADPENYLAANKIEIQDELLKLVGTAREWNLEELAEFVQPLAHGRAYEVGRSAFRVSSCVACHKLGGEGQEIGPDLTQLKPENRTAQHILESLLKPSEKIEEKYRSYGFVLDSGKIVTGMIVEETADAVVIVDNPLAKTKPIRLAKSSIEERIPAAVSIMPQGLLSKLSREEILDLIAYVIANGDRKHGLFKSHEGHKQ